MKRSKVIVILLLGLLLLCSGAVFLIVDTVQMRKFGVIDESILKQIPVEELPDNTLYISYDRRLYQRGDMTLIIPSIGVFTPIGESTEPKYLEEMPGLYEFAALPGEGDVNTSIAGHRDIYDMVFYSLDKLEAGDYLYLLYGDTVYQYELVDTSVVNPDQWEVIEPQGFSCLTLTTCDPIGTNWKRLVARGKLVNWQVFDDTYQFASNSAERQA